MYADIYAQVQHLGYLLAVSLRLPNSRTSSSLHRDSSSLILLLETGIKCLT